MKTIQPDIPNCFVAGFLFSNDLREVLLLHKSRGPLFVRNFWGAVGGHMKVGEGSRGAMAREFLEETGQLVEATEWSGFHSFRYPNGFRGTFLVARDLPDNQRMKHAFNRDETEPVRRFDTLEITARALGLCVEAALSNPEGLAQAHRVSYPINASPLPELAYLLPMALRKLTLPAGFQSLN